MRMPTAALPALAVLCSGSAWAQGDPEIVDRLVEEGRDRSAVWSYAEHLSSEIGPRLTGSSALDRAGAWARDAFTDLGLDAWLEKWGEAPVRFDRGPSSARIVAPVEQAFELTARAWSAGTPGPVRGPVVKLPETLDDYETAASSGAFDGAWVLSRAPARRPRRDDEHGSDDGSSAIADEIDARLAALPIAGRILGAHDDLVRTTSAPGWREMSYDTLPTSVAITVRRADYDALNSRIADGEAVEVEVDLRHHFAEGPVPLYNVVAELRGTDWPEEVVIVSGHLDSWDGPGSHGAQDNATGCAVALEAARLLAAAGAAPRRTIRFMLWTGEEQGLLGSTAYVRSLSARERASISAVLVEDGGTGHAGGLVCIDSMAPMLREAIAPVNGAFPDMPIELVVRERMPRGGGSDHAPFNRVDIPGFFWLERGLEGREGRDYRFIHHTQHDTMRYVVREQLVQSAVATAIVAYNLACADTLLPREAPASAVPQGEPTGNR